MQPHLSGNACLAVLCCISPARKHLEETRSTLKFADNAKRIKVQPTVNEVVDQKAMLLALKKELRTTKDTLLKLRQSLSKSREASLQGTADADTAATCNDSFEQSDASSEVALVDGGQDLDEFITKQVHHVSDLSSVGSNMPPILEVFVMVDSPTSHPEARLEDADERVVFLSNKLDATDGLVESLFRELRDAQEQNLELEMRHNQSHNHFAQLRVNGESQTEDSDLFLQRCRLLKYAISVSLTLYVSGQSELFLGTVFFIWLSLTVATQ
jgi:hypothetical protein